MRSLPSHTTDQSSFVAGTLRRLFLTQQYHLMHFFDTLDLSAASAFAEILLFAPGTIFFTGVGPSGFDALQLSHTLASLGFLRSAFLPPVDALHGDIGVLFPDDILIFISNFGSSDELLSLLPYACARGAYLIPISSVEGNPLAAACDLGVLLLLLEHALCSSYLAPAMSAAIQMLFVDTVVTTLIRAHLLTRNRYVAFRPAGSIGAGLIHKVSNVVSSPADLPFCKEGDLLLDQLSALFGNGCGVLLIVDDKFHLIGTFTDGDLRRSLWFYGVGIFKLTVGEMCNRNPRSICPGALAVEASEKMGSPPSAVPFLPFVENQNVVTRIITLHRLDLPHLGSPSSRSSFGTARATSDHPVTHHTLLCSLSSDILIRRLQWSQSGRRVGGGAPSISAGDALWTDGLRLGDRLPLVPWLVDVWPLSSPRVPPPRPSSCYSFVDVVELVRSGDWDGFSQPFSRCDASVAVCPFSWWVLTNVVALVTHVVEDIGWLAGTTPVGVSPHSEPSRVAHHSPATPFSSATASLQVPFDFVPSLSALAAVWQPFGGQLFGGRG